MAGKPRQKIFCQSLTRRSKRPCLAKGFLCANGKYLCRFHGYNNIKGFNKPNYTDDKRINQLKALYQFRNKTREEVQETRENRDPIERIRALLLSKKYITEDKVKDLDKRIREEVAGAADLAREKKLPDNEDLYRDVYKELDS